MATRPAYAARRGGKGGRVLCLGGFVALAVLGYVFFDQVPDVGGFKTGALSTVQTLRGSVLGGGRKGSAVGGQYDISGACRGQYDQFTGAQGEAEQTPVPGAAGAACAGGASKSTLRMLPAGHFPSPPPPPRTDDGTTQP